MYKTGQTSFYVDKKSVTFTASVSWKLQLIKGLIYYSIITAYPYVTHSLQMFNYIVLYTLLHVLAEVSQLQEDARSCLYVLKMANLGRNM